VGATTPVRRASEPLRRAVVAAAAGWNRFWYEPASTSTLGLLRIAYGTVLTLWALSVAPDVLTFFGDDGVLHRPPDRPWAVGLLHVWSSDTAVVICWIALFTAAVLLTVGYRTRLVAILAIVALASLQRRNPYVLNGGDRLLLNIGFFLALAPAGVALSVDRWRRGAGRFWDHPLRAQWPVRLLQIQVSFMYFFTVWAKIRGTTWHEGTALWYAWNIGDLARFSPPTGLIEWLPGLNVITWGALAVELSLAILVWNRRLRPWVIAAGVAMHLAIDITLTIGFFSAAVLVAYIAFAPPEAADRFLAAVRQRLGQRRFSPLRRLADGPDAADPRAEPAEQLVAPGAHR
jgi:hypothetical protein